MQKPYEDNLNKIGGENWKDLSERSDSPSDTRRESIYTRNIEDSSDRRLESEETHKDKVLRKLKEIEAIIEKAREETTNCLDKTQLRVFVSSASRSGIPIGAIVKLNSYDSKGKCKVIYNDIEYSIKKEYIRKIW
jgi:hypothetical protein